MFSIFKLLNEADVGPIAAIVDDCLQRIMEKSRVLNIKINLGKKIINKTEYENEHCEW